MIAISKKNIFEFGHHKSHDISVWFFYIRFLDYFQIQPFLVSINEALK